MPDYSDTRVNDMIFNVLDSARYNTLLSNNQLNNNQLYFITDDGGTITFTKNNSTFATFTGSNNITIDLTTAPNAIADGGGNEIESTYIKTITYSGNSTTNAAGASITAGSAGLVTMTKGDNTITKIDIPAATASVAGLVNNGAQTIAGTKTFSTGVTIASGTSTKAMFNYSDIQAGTSDAARPVWFAWAGQNGTPVIDTDFTYNPSSNTLKATNFDGLATKATGDANGNNILTTYANSLTLSGNTLTLKNKNGDTLSSVTISASDTKVNVTLGTTSKAYILGTTTTPTGTATGVTSIADSGVYLGTTAGELVATKFTGDLNGNAATATSATSATYDSASHKITDYYVHNITTSSNTLTYKDGDGDQLGTANLVNSVSNTWTAGTTAGPTIKTTVNGVAGTAVAIPSASASASGIVTTGTQTFAGSKTFSSKIIGNLQGNADTATKATQDGGGNVIETTYLKNITVTDSSTKIQLTKGDGTTSKINAEWLPLTGGTVTGTTQINRNIFTNVTSVPENGETVLTALGFKTGYPVYTDPLFESGTNSISVYNNNGSSAPYTSITRMTYSEAGITSPGTGSNYVLRIQNTGSGTTPGLGGFYQTISSRANAVFIQIFRALVPTGYTLYTASNSMGNNYSDVWLTDPKGTGKWEWYARRVLCGKDGSFSSGGHVYLSGTAGTSSAPVKWYLSYCNLYDLTKAQYDGLRTRYADSATSATKATYDGGDNNIESTYIKSLSVSGTTLTIKKGDDTTSTITLQDNNTDTKVNVTLGTTSKAYILGTTTTPTGTAAAVTSIADTGVYLGTTAGELVATKFTGELNGNAKTATKATKDGGDNDIESTYIKSLSVSGTTLTIKKGDDTTSTITLQDNNTDTKVNVKARGTTKAYVLGTTTSPTSSDQAVTSVAETGVYFDTTAAKLVATTFKGALEGNATTATSATNDSGSHKIVDYYVHSITTSSNTLTYKDGDGDQLGTASLVNSVSNTWTAGTSAGPTIKTTVNGVSGTAVAVPSASASASGVVTTGAQTFAGSKTFNSKIIGNLQGIADSATKATQDSNGNNILNYYIHSITFNSSTSKLTYANGNGDPTDVLLPFLLLTGGNVTGPVSFGDAVSIDSLTVGSLVSTGVARFNNGLIGNLTGNADTATKATQDSSGNNILGFYGHSLALSGSTLSLKNGNGDTLNSVTISTNDTKNTAGSTQSTSKLFLIGAPSQAANPQTYSSSKVYVTDGTLTATTFSGNLSGNATTATSATKATQDGAGNNIEETYIKTVSFSIDSNGNSKYTTTKGDGTTTDITPVVAQIIRW